MSKKPSLIGERMKQPIALEKKIAIVSVVLSLLLPLAYLIYINIRYYGYFSIDRSFIENLLGFWVSIVASYCLYMRLRSGAVIGAIFLSLVLYCWMAYDILTSIDTKAGIAWIFYYIWGLFCFISSIYPSIKTIKKPRFFTKSAWSAFFAAIATNLFGTILIIFLCVLGKQILWSNFLSRINYVYCT